MMGYRYGEREGMSPSLTPLRIMMFAWHNSWDSRECQLTGEIPRQQGWKDTTSKKQFMFPSAT